MEVVCLKTSVLIITVTVLGILVLIAGLLYGRFPSYTSFRKFSHNTSLEKIASSKPFGPFLNFLTGNRKGGLYRFSYRMITRSEVNMSVQALYLLKIISVVVVATLLLLVRHTNMDITRLSIISKPANTFSLFQDVDTSSYAYNISLYNAVMKKVGADVLKKLDMNGQVERIRAILPELLHDSSFETLDEKAASLAATFNSVRNLKLINLPMVLIVMGSFWLPELVLLLRRVLLGNMYRKEVIKLENIFELLGGIRGFKTIRIMEEMAGASKVYGKHLNCCIQLFKTEREQALDMLKSSVNNSRFSRLVDVMRVYSTTDKALALQILERNRLEKEEEILLTAEEDVDIVDLFAFISILPVILELATLLMKPLLETIYEAFKFI